MSSAVPNPHCRLLANLSTCSGNINDEKFSPTFSSEAENFSHSTVRYARNAWLGYAMDMKGNVIAI